MKKVFQLEMFFFKKKNLAEQILMLHGICDFQ